MSNGCGGWEQLVRMGTISSVNVKKRTARVMFKELGILSGELKVLVNTPLVTVEKTVDGAKWEYDARYASVERDLGLGENYDKTYPDIIKNSISLDYHCPEHGTDETKQHEQVIKIHPWLPYIGQMVICLYRANGDGFVIGGIE